MREIIFITGTDTGVGKTLLTSLLLLGLRESGRHAWAMKPFSAGSRRDALWLNSLQGNELPIATMNPFHFPQPVAPWIAAGKTGQVIPLELVLKRVETLRQGCDCLLVEGVGGLLAPLGPGYALPEMARALGGSVVVVGANKLGVLNHALLIAAYLRHAKIEGTKYVLMGQKKPVFAARSNRRALESLLAPDPLFAMPFLGPQACSRARIEEILKKVQKIVAQILRSGRVCSVATEKKEQPGKTEAEKNLKKF